MNPKFIKLTNLSDFIKGQIIGARVIYWLSTEPSIKRYTCVNKRNNSGSKWTCDNDITRCPDGSSQLETRCWSESQRQTEGFGPSASHGWATPAKMRKKCCYCREKNLGQYSSLSLSSAHLSHTTNINPFENKVWEIYIFIKKCVRLFIEVRKSCLIMFPLIFVLRLYNTRMAGVSVTKSLNCLL